MPSLEMSLGLRIRSKVNSVQNNIEKKTLLFMSPSDHAIPIKFTETI